MKGEIKKYGFIFNQEGTVRNKRYADALNPVTVIVDDRKLADFIVYAQHYTKSVRFIPAEGEIDLRQTWNAFFKDSTVLLMANIATKETEEIKTDYYVLKARFLDVTNLETFEQLSAYVFSRYVLIDEWYASASNDIGLSQDIRLYVKSYLAKELRRLNEILIYLHGLKNDAERTFNLSKQLQNKDDLWGLAEWQPSTATADSFKGSTDNERLINASLTLNKVFDVVFHVTTAIVANCKRYFDSSLFEQQSHPPHVALFITFIKLFGYAQAGLNELPKKLLDHYYKEVLQIMPKPAKPDCTFVVFEIAKGFDTYHVKKGTALVAGKDKTGRELIYQTDKDLLINKGQVAAVKNIFIQNNSTGILNYYADTLKGTLLKDLTVKSWKPFGTPNKVRRTSIGLGIASTQFYLAKGQRNVSVVLNLRSEFAFEAFDISLFELRLTGEDGWLSSLLLEDAISIHHFKRLNLNQLELNFSIPIAQQSAVIAFDPAIHHGEYVTAFPILEILLVFPVLPADLTSDLYTEYKLQVDSLNALQNIDLVGAEVRVQVGTMGSKVNFDGIKDLVLQNHNTVLDGKKPFMPFTALPQVGSSFYIGCNDLYYKPIQRIELNIEWMLPDNFRSYYDKYFPPYDANQFTASLSVLKKQNWQKLDDVSVIDTYANDPQFRLLIVNPQIERAVSDVGTDEAVYSFDIAKPDGTLKLKLNYPDFGHDIYAQLITATVTERASSKLAMVDFYKIVKKQLHDSVITIKYPDDTGDEKGTLKVVIYNVLNLIKDDDKARGMMITGLDDKLKKINGSEVTFNQIQEVAGNMSTAGGNITLVNDNNFVERIIRFLKKIKLIDRSVHFDEDKDNVESIVADISDRLDTRVNFILPADQELVALIISETNSAISKVVVKIADKLIRLRQTGIPNGDSVNEVIKKEIDDANEVINDLIARKIATLLSAHDIPPKPYTPLINTLAISYSSTKTLEPDKDTFFQILPFGVKPLNMVDKPAAQQGTGTHRAFGSAKVFPGYLINDEANYSGLLMVGIKDIVPNQNLSLLFQVAEGTRGSERKASILDWWYLKNNEWLKLEEKDLLSDGTMGLQTTGIVEVSLPGDANNSNTIFDEKGLFWLAISVDKNIDAFPDLLDIKTQVVQATFRDAGNNPTHLNLPLPAGKLTKVLDNLPGIKGVAQPVASMHGKMQELDPEYYTRVSERLRHKGRAINTWDYEHLVLEQFLFVYKIKCLNNYNQGEFAIGHITLVPVVDLTNRFTGPVNAGMPLANYMQLRSIENFIAARCPAFVKVHAINPQLDYVRVSCKVKFIAGLERGFYLQKLNEDIISFLTPWVTGDQRGLSFSAKIYASSLISFIDKRPYVDYVADLYLNQYTLQGSVAIYAKAENQSSSLIETQFTTAHSLLVSAAAHDLELL
jgi:hypothetical protein